MPNPQQPELRRSGHHAVDDDAAATKLPAQATPATGGETGPVPDDNLPGHHPADDQDKPDGDEFVAKAREVAARARAAQDAADEPAEAARTGAAQGWRDDGATPDRSDGGQAAAPSTPPSSAPVADAPSHGAGPAAEADAPSATPAAVAAEAMEDTPAAAAGTPGTGTAAPGPSDPSPAPAPVPAPGRNPFVSIATFQWRVATLPARIALDVLERVRRRF